ncbi:hypothetical protein DUI87_03491 [Hirundo rustica rustica]|uniref:Integrase-type domain-containing protein n=1 Tax=Hirundo rustica rustica TaxID=333673 RepID=A0A3M0L7F8_HIRRU|nr:hypothetical protein DUI87_03491 [Hirundo rustica rustica]
MTPHSRLAKVLYAINHLMVPQNSNNPVILNHHLLLQALDETHQPRVKVRVRNLVTKQREGPYDLIASGRGYACISTDSGVRWVPAKCVHPDLQPQRENLANGTLETVTKMKVIKWMNHQVMTQMQMINKEMQSIMKIIFSQEERQIIRTAGIRVWERENLQRELGDQKMTVAPPDWNHNSEQGRRSMNDYRYNVSKDTVKVTGAKGESFTVPVIKNVVIEGETRIWMGDILLVPGTGSNLLGRDLQVKLGIGVIPQEGKMMAKILKLDQEDEDKINKEVWTGEGNKGGLDIDPIRVTIEREEYPIRVHQYPTSLEGREGLKLVMELIKDGTLEPCMSPHNTPILPVKKPDGNYRLVQDLWEVNKRTQTCYPVVPNPYTLLSKVPPQNQWFSVVDLKDAFWACPSAEES